MWDSESIKDDGERLLRSYDDVLAERQETEEHHTSWYLEQENVEETVLRIYKMMKQRAEMDDEEPLLMRHKHIAYLKKSLTHLTVAYECLDSSRPWLCYWILNALQILGEKLEAEDYSQIAGFLARCQSPEGGFGGGPGQHPHLAPTYAAVNSLCTIGTPEAYKVIDRKTLRQFLNSLRGEDGAFSMHVGGEVDIRGVYCAVAVARLTNVYSPEVFKGTPEWIAKCQTWEGGFGGRPEMEAHGGYTFCGLAALVSMGKVHLCDVPSLLRWAVNRQMRLEGGFQGRTNKLVDGCYSFWQGAVFPMLHAILSENDKGFESDYWLFDQVALQEYVLICCQHASGGLLDKPGKPRDVYHTCYGLSGLSVAQNSPVPLIIGRSRVNAVETIHPVYNLTAPKAAKALRYFSTLTIPD